MLKRLYRQRRRLILLTALLTLSVLITQWSTPDLRFEIKHGEMAQATGQVVFANVIGVAFLLLCASALILFFPSARRLTETAGLAFVFTEAIKGMGGVLPTWALDGAAPWIWYFAFFYGVATVLERDLFFHAGLRLPLKFTQTRLINATPDGVWAALAPERGSIGTYWTGSIAQVDQHPEAGPDTVNVRYHMGPPLSFVQTQTRRIWERPFHLLYDFKPEGSANTSTGTSGSFEMLCAPQPDGRSRVTITHTYPAVGFGTWSLLWLDDMGGSEMDAIAARLEGRRDRSIAGWSARKMAGA